MKELLRRAAWHIAPGVMADRAATWNRALRERQGIGDDARRYTREHGLVVSGGPFIGLRYPEGRELDVDYFIAKLQGKYEGVLHRVIDEAAATRPKVFINIGTADGYYAVGFARRTGAAVYGFEPSRIARTLCAEVAEVNGVAITFLGAATSRLLRRVPLDAAFVLSDCEGAEASIFDDAAVNSLSAAVVVIELHEFAAPGVTALLSGRFRTTHRVEIIEGTNSEPLRRSLGAWLVAHPRAQSDDSPSSGSGMQASRER